MLDPNETHETPNEVTIEMLPDEILLSIFKYIKMLDPVKQTSKRFYNLARDKQMSSFFGKPNTDPRLRKKVNNFVLSKDETLLATYENQCDSGANRLLYAITIWDLKSGNVKHTINLGKDVIRRFSFSGNNKIIYVLSNHQKPILCIHDLDSNIKSTLRLNDGLIDFLDVQANGTIILGRSYLSGDNAIYLYLDAVSSNNAISTIQIGMDDRKPQWWHWVKYVLTAQNEILTIDPFHGKVTRYDSQLSETGQFMIDKLPENNYINSLAIQGNHLVFSRNHEVEIWDIVSGKQVSLLKSSELTSENIQVLNLSKDKQHLLIVTRKKAPNPYSTFSVPEDDTLFVFNNSSGTLVNRIQINDFPKLINQAAFISGNEILLNIERSPVFDERGEEVEEPEDLHFGLNLLQFKM